ncbi:hypothetical protein LCDV1gp092 [Lymphocystis disease virus 1]|uniref:hypothetical protein n=1 Tax=Fish lymphocystis disease virus TaxID=36363 RepID=UPI0000161E9F|nr:hypothetical protein LCDV1gp092 [Lymphocystis disease virus 1]
MAKIANKVVELPHIITLEKFFKLVAFDMASLPKFIRWLPKKPVTLKDLLIPGYNYEVENVLPSLINASALNFEHTAYAQIDASLVECETLFTVFHTLQADPSFKILLKTKQVLKEINVIDVLNNAETIRLKHQTEKFNLSRAVAQINLDNEQFMRNDLVAYTDLEPSKIRYTLKLGYYDLTHDELFNALIPNDTTPLILSNKFVKVLRGFTVFDNEFLDNAILLKVNAEKLNLKSLKDPFKKYSNVAFMINQNILYGTFDLPVGKRFISRQEFTKRTLSTLKLPLGEPEFIDVGYVAVFALLNQTINIPIIADLVLTHPLVSQIVCIDESVRSHKKKPTAYLHFPDTDQTASLQEKTVERFNQYPNTKEGDFILLIRIKTVDQKQAIKIREILAKIITIYNREKNNIIEFYRNYIPTFAKRESKKPQFKTKKIALKDVAPDIFIPTYSRQCLNIPETISSIDDIENTPYMKFPVYGESEPRYYICPYKTHPYPGLRINNLNNKIKFPYIPCCYSKDQSQRKDSKWQLYFNKVKINKEIYQTRNDYYIDVLPLSLVDFFKTMTTLNLIRIAGSYSAESALIACKWAYKTEMTPKHAMQLRRSFAANELNVIICLQELYAVSDERSLNKLRAQFLVEEAFILEHYFRLLEEIFNVYIYCFDNEGFISWPALKAHYRFKPKNKQVILIYKSQTFKGVQYDLIAALTEPDRKGPIKNSITSFSPLDPFITKLYNFVSDLTKIYVTGSLVPKLYLKNLNIVAQKLDFYGKTQILVLEEFTIETEPLPPFYVPLYDKVELPKIGSLAKINQVFGTRFKIQAIDEQRVTGLLDDCCKCSVLLEEVKIETYFLQDLTIAEKTARLLKEYVKKVFVTHYDLTKELQFKDFSDFAVQHITIIPDYKYNTPFKSKFKENNFTAEKSVILPDEETTKRLIYYLFLEYSYNKLTFEKYHDATSIPNFFITPTDFILSDNYFVIPVESTGNFIEYELYDIILPLTHTKPYLFINAEIVYLVQNCATIELACYIITIWKKEGYNPELKSYVNIGIPVEIDIVLWSKNKPMVSLDNKTINDSLVLIHKDYNELAYAALMKL